MGLFDKWLWGEPAGDEQADHTPDARYSGTFDDDCTWAGPGVYYVYIVGLNQPVQVAHTANVRHALRWARYQFSRDDQFPELVSLRWEAVATSTDAEAAALNQQDVRRTASQRIERAA